MFKKISTLLFFIFFSHNAFSQLPNFNTTLLKQLDTHGNGYSALWGYTAQDGREYVLLGCNAGTAFIDITDSSNIVEVDFLTGVSSGWREMKTYSHYAYIVSEGTNSKLQVVDLQYLPDSVSLVQTWGYTGYTKTHSIQQEGHYLYLNGGNSAANGGVTVVDVSDPENPVKMGQWTTLYVHDCRVQEDTIWACNIYTGQLSIINATNKSTLSTVRTWQSYPQQTVSTHNCDFTADNNYLLTTNEISQPNGKLNIWDISDRNNIIYKRDWLPTNITSSIVHNVEVYGNYAVIAHYSAGIRIVDITDPLNPTEFAWYDTYPTNNNSNYSGCWGVYMFPSGKIAGSDISGGLFVIRTNSVMTGTGNSLSSVPEEYSLSQNYPNPFNPNTGIKFSIKENSNVKLTVFNALGTEVSSLVNDRRDAGNYEVNFDAGSYGLGSGTYFYRLEVESSSGRFSETKKMLLIK